MNGLEARPLHSVSDELTANDSVFDLTMSLGLHIHLGLNVIVGLDDQQTVADVFEERQTLDTRGSQQKQQARAVRKRGDGKK